MHLNHPLKHPKSVIWLIFPTIMLIGMMLSLQQEILPVFLILTAFLVILPFLLSSPWLCACGTTIFLYTGILVAVDIGFTLKAAQLFSLLGLFAINLSSLTRYNSIRIDFKYLFPFVLFFLLMLPSLWNVDIFETSLNHEQTSLRLIFNYLFVQLIALIIFLAANTPQRLKTLLKLSFLSCFISLIFGYFQQIGYYLGFYNPRLYEGIHSSIVDLYGPFLRFAPGTFANEYGQILQTTGLLVAGYLFLNREILSKGSQFIYALFLWSIVLALALNLTRASWMVFGIGLMLILLAARARWYTLITVGLAFGGLLTALSYFSQTLVALDALYAVQQRFSELSNITAFSAGQRLEFWQEAWLAFLEHPWIGNGWGTYVVTHNVPLQLLAETGIIGFFAFYGLMTWIALKMWRGWRQATDPMLKNIQFSLLLAFGGCLAFDMTNHGLLHFVFWFTIALGLATARLNIAGEAP